MDFHLLIASPTSEKYVVYVPDQYISGKIRKLINKKKKHPETVEIKIDNISIIMLDVKDESGYNTGFISDNNIVTHKIRWSEIIRFDKTLNTDIVEQYLEKIGVRKTGWKLYWIASLYHELQYKYNKYKITQDIGEKILLAKRIMAIRYELLNLYYN